VFQVEKKEAAICYPSERALNFLEFPVADNCHANSRLTRFREVSEHFAADNDDCEEPDGFSNSQKAL
jgi:hypothetical protein